MGVADGEREGGLEGRSGPTRSEADGLHVPAAGTGEQVADRLGPLRLGDEPDREGMLDDEAPEPSSGGPERIGVEFLVERSLRVPNGSDERFLGLVWRRHNGNLSIVDGYQVSERGAREHVANADTLTGFPAQILGEAREQLGDLVGETQEPVRKGLVLECYGRLDRQGEVCDRNGTRRRHGLCRASGMPPITGQIPSRAGPERARKGPSGLVAARTKVDIG